MLAKAVQNELKNEELILTDVAELGYYQYRYGKKIRRKKTNHNIS